jgi:hypothetical protein
MALLVFSCQEDEKEPAPETYFIQATINNTVVEFKDQPSLGATTAHYGDQYELGIYGNIEEITGILIQIYDTEPLGLGNYSGLVQTDNQMVGVRFSYVDELDNYLTDFSNPEGSLTISMLNDTLVRGFFSGVVKKTSSEETLTITNGEFFVKLVN